VNFGSLKVTSVSEDASGSCLTVNFNPMVMPKGVVASADPLLPARAAPYAISQGRRLGEGAKQQ
jgi:catalase